jgi:phage portal protein BeeE
MEMFSYQGVGYSVYGGDNQNRERDTTSFTRYVGEFYRDNGIIFAVILSRMLLFTEAKFQWQRLINGRPGDLFGTPTLSLLEVPWPNGTTGDLLARMEQDVSLHGNFYATREGDRIRRLRPDWVEIILDSAPGEAVTTNIVGYLYKPGGSDSSTAPKVYTPQEVAHWAPIPDPLAQYRGMSWLTPVIREMVADRAATDHKLKFFENAATPNLAVSFSENITKDQFNAFMAAMNAAHQGTANAYKTLYLGGGADVKTIGANMDQMDFKNTQGAGETRICAAGGVPPIIVGLSEGLASATYSNYGMARRKFGDHWARPQWRSACAALAVLLDVPSGARLWYDDRDIAFLREDQKDVAAIQSQQATTMKSLVDSGYEPDSVTAAMLNEDWSLLKHTGLFSVQLQPPGTVQKAGAMAAGTGPVAGLPAGGSGPNDTTPAKTAAGGQPTPAAGGQTKSGTATPAKPATPSQPSSATPATPARDTDELAELREQVASLTSLVTDLVTQRTDWTPDAHPRDTNGKFADTPGSGGGGHLAGLTGALAKFKSDGGEVRIQSEPAQSLEELDTLTEMMGPDFASDKGVDFTRAALEEPGATVLVADVDGAGLGGALAMRKLQNDEGGDFYYVEYVGSTGMAKGAGSALAQQAAQIAARDDLPLLGEPDSREAEAFWRKVGWTDDPLDNGTELLGWTPEQVKEVAGL